MSYEQITIPSCDHTELEARLYASHPGEGTASDTGEETAFALLQLGSGPLSLRSGSANIVFSRKSAGSCSGYRASLWISRWIHARPVSEMSATPSIDSNLIPRHSVVQALKDTLCRNGIKVLLYNSRGVGRSRGRASWTGEPERKDYQAVTDWLISTEAKLIRTEAKLLDTEVKEVGDSTVHTRKTLEVFCCVSTQPLIQVPDRMALIIRTCRVTRMAL